MYNTTVIIPIHKLENDDVELLSKALESLKEQKDKKFEVALVIPIDLKDKSGELKIEEYLGNDIKYQWIYNDGLTVYQSQINFTVDKVDTPYVSILQYDDEFLPNYIKNVNNYIEAYGYDVYSSIVFELDKDQKFIGFANEAVWSINHMLEFGRFDLSNTKKHNYVNYSMCGATIKIDTFKEVGKLKTSMVKFHDYEFLLRLLQMGKKVYVMPKITYKHVNGRKNSIHDLQKNMGEDERKFWYELAKKEFHFDYDREIEYSYT